MTIKLIVTDMDGTLLRYDDKLSDMTLDTIKRCEEKGISIILASGRTYRRLMPYAEQLQMKKYSGALIEVNGMAIYHLKTNERIIFQRLKRNEVMELCQVLLPYEVEIQVYFDDGFYFYIPDSITPYKLLERKQRKLPSSYPWTSGPWSWNHNTLSGYPKQMKINHFKEIRHSALNKINISHQKEYLDQIYYHIYSKLNSSYQVARTCSRMIEITPKSVSKGQALKRYMKENHISSDEVIVFGDGGNDIDMFHAVNLSIAMGNAADEIKKEAVFVTCSNSEDGVAKALRRFVLK